MQQVYFRSVYPFRFELTSGYSYSSDLAIDSVDVSKAVSNDKYSDGSSVAPALKSNTTLTIPGKTIYRPFITIAYLGPLILITYLSYY